MEGNIKQAKRGDFRVSIHRMEVRQHIILSTSIGLLKLEEDLNIARR